VTPPIVPVWFGPEDSPLFGLINAPEEEVRGAVVLCPPFGREFMNSYSSFAQLAARLAALGFAALRFDYRSTGDSFDRTGDDPDSGGFIEDIGFAVDFVRKLGASRVAIVGMRIGATFAAIRCALEPVDALVLWDPCVNGRSFLREQRALGLLIQHQTALAPVLAGSGGSGDRVTSGAFEVPGIGSSPQILDELSGLDLPATGKPLGDNVLLLTRSGRTSDRKLLARTELSNAEHREVGGQPELLDVAPPAQVVPVEGIEAVAGWLDHIMPEERQPLSLPSRREVKVRIRRPTSRTSGEDDDVELVERSVLLGPQELFGITTEPAQGGSGPMCVFVSVSNEHRVGPGRLWVELSRRLATAGFRCLRLDVNGVGDSPARGGVTRQPVYSALAIDDVIDAARAVSSHDPSDVLLVGLCSSAYHVLEAAWVLSARGVCALNPGVIFQPPEVANGGTIDPRRRFCVPQIAVVVAAKNQVSLRLFWQRFPRLPWSVRRVVRMTRKFARKLQGPVRAIAWRSRSLLSPSNRLGDRLADLAETGTDVYMISGPEEIRPFLHSGIRAIRRAQETGRLRMDVIPALDHAVRPSSDRDEVAQRIVDHVLSRFG
jgi:pimeloyl-ACP methyl ester carboxylesterase